ncbi:MAG: GNAT family N-acetyltransferase [Deltaproteobacteria bacterium]|nr:GNAT family N-acetyltransferase [Deltaproteobacteria bacterium]
MPTAVRIVPVHDRRDLQHFLKLPWQIYRNDPFWVPPLLFDQKQLLNRRKHPFHQHAEVEYFLAWRGEEVVGRIAAVINHQYVQFHEEKTGFFGFFESVDDVEVASALLTTAEQWVAARGMQHICGPMNFSTNEECALLVDGFHSAPTVMMPYNPPYYAPLLEAAQYHKAKDLLAYLLDDTTPPPRLVHGVERLLRHQKIVIRPFNLKQFKQEVEKLTVIYQSAWERNWGFVPMTPAEFDTFADQMWWVANPNLCLLAEANGEAIGFALALPDYNQVLRHMNGRLLPFGIVKFLWYRRKISRARVLILGLKPGFRRRGIDAMLYLRLWQEAPRNGYPVVECSWILEDNWDMRRALQRMGARLYKTYRVYEKQLANATTS